MKRMYEEKAVLTVRCDTAFFRADSALYSPLHSVSVEDKLAKKLIVSIVFRKLVFSRLVAGS